MDSALRLLLGQIQQSSTIEEVGGHIMDQLPNLAGGPVAAFFLFEKEGRQKVLDMCGRDSQLAQRYLDHGAMYDEVLKSVFESAQPVHDLMLRTERCVGTSPDVLELRPT